MFFPALLILICVHQERCPQQKDFQGNIHVQEY